MLSLSQLIAIGIAYLAFLFASAYFTNQHSISRKIAYHPITQMLSVGVYASVWTFFGAIGLASQSGQLYLASYIGATAMFLLAPLILIPILRLTRTYHLSSLADLFAFRYRSGLVGFSVAVLTVIATFPLLSIQIQAISDTLHLFSPSFRAEQFALGFCATLGLFTILFGAREATLRAKNPGLMVAMAISAVIKLIAMVVFGGYAFFVILGGFDGLASWQIAAPEGFAVLDTDYDENIWRTMVLAFFAGSVIMPHMFHMMFTENSSEETLYKVSWGMPLYLLLMAIAVPPILWVGYVQGIGGDPAFLMLNIGNHLNSSWLTILVFIGGLAAASGITIVATLAMASMLQNHAVLPLIPLPGTHRLYRSVIWLRRLLILLVMSGCYLFYVYIGQSQDLHHLGIVAVIAFLQFFPGLLSTLFWPKANRWGLLAGLFSGMVIWAVTLIIPLMKSSSLTFDMGVNISDIGLDQAATLSLCANVLMLYFVSLMTGQNSDEEQAANACSLNAIQQPTSANLTATRIEDFNELISARLGAVTARREIQLAKKSLSLAGNELRPVDLLRLRTQLEHNLTALLGPVEAASLLSPLDHSRKPNTRGLSFGGRNLHLLEDQLENYREQLTGLAAELDTLRRYQRQILERIPVGICTLDANKEVLFWNPLMAALTELEADDCIGLPVRKLPQPWATLLTKAASGNEGEFINESLEIAGKPKWYSVHVTPLESHLEDGVVILLEDETEDHLLRRRLAHNERLSSIGRFAAGVAHEIGNPVTGIACLAQNLKLETDEPEILDSGDQIIEQTERISTIVQTLVRFAHAGDATQDTPHEQLSVLRCIEESIRLVSLTERGKFRSFITHFEDNADVMGDAQQLAQVFVNLLNNACDASDDGSAIHVRTQLGDNQVIIDIIDGGEGIAPEHIEKLFEPFFTTKAPGKGTGLGLALVYNIIEEHYGNIQVTSPADNKQNKGTCVSITLPLA